MMLRTELSRVTRISIGDNPRYWALYSKSFYEDLFQKIVSKPKLLDIYKKMLKKLSKSEQRDALTFFYRLRRDELDGAFTWNEQNMKAKSKFYRIVEVLGLLDVPVDVPVLQESNITTIPNFNLESDVAIELLKLARRNAKFNSSVIYAGIEFYSMANPRNVFSFLVNSFRTVVNEKLVKDAFDSVNKKYFRIEFQKDKRDDIINRCANILALAVMFEFKEDPLGFARSFSDKKLIDAASQFSASRGSQKLGIMVGSAKKMRLKQ
jgi:hypothetical protein